MKPNRNIWLWIALEILVAFIVHLLLREMARGFAGPRAWWKKFRGTEADFSNHTSQPPPTEVRNNFFRN